MKATILFTAIILASVGSCAPPGYVYDTGSFTPRLVDSEYPPNPPRLPETPPVQASCDGGLTEALKGQLDTLRREEDRIADNALHDNPPGSFARSMELGQQDRDLQDRIIAVCPDG